MSPTFESNQPDSSYVSSSKRFSETPKYPYLPSHVNSDNASSLSRRQTQSQQAPIAPTPLQTSLNRPAPSGYPGAYDQPYTSNSYSNNNYNSTSTDDLESIREQLAKAQELLAKQNKLKFRLKSELTTARTELAASKSELSDAQEGLMRLKETQEELAAAKELLVLYKMELSLSQEAHLSALGYIIKQVDEHYLQIELDLASVRHLLESPWTPLVREGDNGDLTDYMPTQVAKRCWERDEEWDSDVDVSEELAWWRVGGGGQQGGVLGSPMSGTTMLDDREDVTTGLISPSSEISAQLSKMRASGALKGVGAAGVGEKSVDDFGLRSLTSKRRNGLLNAPIERGRVGEALRSIVGPEGAFDLVDDDEDEDEDLLAPEKALYRGATKVSNKNVNLAGVDRGNSEYDEIDETERDAGVVLERWNDPKVLKRNEREQKRRHKKRTSQRDEGSMYSDDDDGTRGGDLTTSGTSRSNTRYSPYSSDEGEYDDDHHVNNDVDSDIDSHEVDSEDFSGPSSLSSPNQRPAATASTTATPDIVPDASSALWNGPVKSNLPRSKAMMANPALNWHAAPTEDFLNADAEAALWKGAVKKAKKNETGAGTVADSRRSISVVDDGIDDASSVVWNGPVKSKATTIPTTTAASSNAPQNNNTGTGVLGTSVSSSLRRPASIVLGMGGIPGSNNNPLPSPSLQMKPHNPYDDIEDPESIVWNGRVRSTVSSSNSVVVPMIAPAATGVSSSDVVHGYTVPGYQDLMMRTGMENDMNSGHNMNMDDLEPYVVGGDEEQQQQSKRMGGFGDFANVPSASPKAPMNGGDRSTNSNNNSVISNNANNVNNNSSSASSLASPGSWFMKPLKNLVETLREELVSPSSSSYPSPGSAFFEEQPPTTTNNNNNTNANINSNPSSFYSHDNQKPLPTPTHESPTSSPAPVSKSGVSPPRSAGMSSPMDAKERARREIRERDEAFRDAVAAAVESGSAAGAVDFNIVGGVVGGSGSGGMSGSAGIRTSVVGAGSKGVIGENAGESALGASNKRRSVLTLEAMTFHHPLEVEEEEEDQKNVHVNRVASPLGDSDNNGATAGVTSTSPVPSSSSSKKIRPQRIRTSTSYSSMSSSPEQTHKGANHSQRRQNSQSDKYADGILTPPVSLAEHEGPDSVVKPLPPTPSPPPTLEKDQQHQSHFDASSHLSNKNDHGFSSSSSMSSGLSRQQKRRSTPNPLLHLDTESSNDPNYRNPNQPQTPGGSGAPGSTLERMASAFENVLESAIENPWSLMPGWLRNGGPAANGGGGGGGVTVASENAQPRNEENGDAEVQYAGGPSKNGLQRRATVATASGGH
jgi:hypothetical protein